jgi:CBS domain-containing protein
VTAEAGASISGLAFTMANERVGSVVIVDGTDVLGIVTDRDIALDVLGTGADPEAYTARDVMTPDPLTVEAGDGVMDTIRAMCDSAVRRVPVVEDGRLVGIVTHADFLVLLATELSNLAGVVEAESPPYA